MYTDTIQQAITRGEKVALVIGLSAGKDSTAVALLAKDKLPNLDTFYVFADTGAELPETYEYLSKLEDFLGKKIEHLKSKYGDLEHIIKVRFNGYLPSAMSRFCTRMSKIDPFREFMDGLAQKYDRIFNLVGIRADEPQRTGYVPCGEYAAKVETLLPLADEGMKLNDVFNLVENAIGLPKYYAWRTRSGCTFCVPGDVEVLTENGWVRFDSYTGEDPLAQFDPHDDTISFVKPEALHKIPFEGHLIHVQSRLVNVMTTPNHRWLQKNKRRLDGPWEFIEAEDLPLQFFVPTSGTIISNNLTFAEPHLRLAVAIQADGWITGQRAILGFKKQRKIDRFLELSTAAGIDVHALKACNDTKARFSVSLDFLKEHSYLNIREKKWTWDLLKLSPASLRIILDELKYWDCQNVTDFGSYTYLTAVKSNAEIIQAAGHCSNYIASIFQRDNGVAVDGRKLEIYGVNIQTSKNYTMVAERNHHTRVQFAGITYCVTVPTGAFLIKSKGKILVTGNCFFQRRMEWVNLKERHPELFEHAKTFESNKFTWIKGMSLDDLEQKSAKIKERYLKRIQKLKDSGSELSLTDAAILESSLGEEDESGESCSVCR